MEFTQPLTVWVIPSNLSADQIDAALRSIRDRLGFREFTVVHPDRDEWVELSGEDACVVVSSQTTRRELAPYLINNNVPHLHIINVSYLV